MMSLIMEAGRSPGDFMLDGDPAPPEIMGTAPTQFSAHVHCSHTAGLIKMPLGTHVGFGPAPPKIGTVPSFRLTSIVAKRLDGSRCHLERR